MELRHNPQLQLRSASTASRPTVQPLHTPGIVILTIMMMIVIFAFARNSDNDDTVVMITISYNRKRTTAASNTAQSLQARSGGRDQHICDVQSIWHIRNICNIRNVCNKTKTDYNTLQLRMAGGRADTAAGTLASL